MSNQVHWLDRLFIGLALKRAKDRKEFRTTEEGNKYVIETNTGKIAGGLGGALNGVEVSQNHEQEQNSANHSENWQARVYGINSSKTAKRAKYKKNPGKPRLSEWEKVNLSHLVFTNCIKQLQAGKPFIKSFGAYQYEFTPTSNTEFEVTGKKRVDNDSYKYYDGWRKKKK